MTQTASSPVAKNSRPKLWLAVRIEGYGLQLLTTAEEWEQYSTETLLHTDRETVYQAARRNGGLLCRADSLLSAGQAAALKDRVRSILAPPQSHGDTDPATATTEEQDLVQQRADALPGTKADIANKRAEKAASRKAGAGLSGTPPSDDQTPY